MNENKLIEEMARDIAEAGVAISGLDLAYSSVHGADNDSETQFMRIARHLYYKNYRRQCEPISCGHENGGKCNKITVELPCKVGDTLYVISQMKDKRFLPFIREYEVTSIVVKKKSIVVYHEMDSFIKIIKQADFGKSVFLTKEEAEQALKGGE